MQNNNTAQLDAIVKDLKDRTARIDCRTMNTIARFEAHIKDLKARAARIEARTRIYAEHSDMEMLATLYQDIGMFSQELDRVKARQ